MVCYDMIYDMIYDILYYFQTISPTLFRFQDTPSLLTHISSSIYVQNVGVKRSDNTNLKKAQRTQKKSKNVISTYTTVYL